MQLTTLKQSLRDFEKHQKALPELQHVFGLVRRGSKHIIAVLRRDEANRVNQVNQLIKDIEQDIKRGVKKASDTVELEAQGFYREAIEEYVEAKLYFAYVTDKKVSFPGYIPLSFWDLLGGWSDFTGELVRRAISLAHEKDIKDIEKLKTITENVVERFSQVSFSGKLRNKYDSAERNLKRLEEILYELKLRSD